MKEPKDTLIAGGIFLLIVISWSAIVLGIVNLLYHGIPADKTQKFIWFTIIMVGYYRSFKWLVKRLRAIGSKHDYGQQN